MKKLVLITITAIISILGGELMAKALFHVTGPDEIVNACAVLIGFAIYAIYRIVITRPSESAAVRLAAYEERRDRNFREIEANNFMLKYELYSRDLERR